MSRYGRGKVEPSALDNMGWIEIVFGGIVALGFGFWQLWSINREIAKDKEKAGKERAPEKE